MYRYASLRASLRHSPVDAFLTSAAPGYLHHRPVERSKPRKRHTIDSSLEPGIAFLSPAHFSLLVQAGTIAGGGSKPIIALKQKARDSRR
jgi:hypothetical protein